MSAETSFYKIPDYVMVSDTKAAGSNGDAAVAGSWQKATINTEDSDSSGICAIAASVITLQPGTYTVDISVPAYITNSINLRLRNTTDGATTLVGEAGYRYDAVFAQAMARIRGKFTISAAKNFEIQYYTSAFAGVARIGYNALNSGESVKFTTAVFERIAN